MKKVVASHVLPLPHAAAQPQHLFVFCSRRFSPQYLLICYGRRKFLSTSRHALHPRCRSRTSGRIDRSPRPLTVSVPLLSCLSLRPRVVVSPLPCLLFLLAGQVIELRAVVQRVDEGPSVRVHPRAFAVRQVSGMRAYLRNGGSGRSSGGAMITTTGVFPPVSQGEDRFAPRLTINTGSPDNGSSASTAAAMGGSWRGGATPSTPACESGTPSLALFEFASVDFFIEAAGCPTEADFLRLEACVDVAVSHAVTPAAVVGGARSDTTTPRLHALSVGLTEANPPPSPRASSAFGLHAMGVEMGRPIKRRF